MKIRNIILEILAGGIFIAVVVGAPIAVFRYHVKQTCEHYRGEIIQIIARNDEIEGEHGHWMVQENQVWNYNDKGAPHEIRVSQGKEVTLLITAADTIHEFTLNEYDLKKKIYPGKVEHLSFITATPGYYKFTCTTFCGIGHEEMVGNIIVVEEETSSIIDCNMFHKHGEQND